MAITELPTNQLQRRFQLLSLMFLHLAKQHLKSPIGIALMPMAKQWIQRDLAKLSEQQLKQFVTFLQQTLSDVDNSALSDEGFLTNVGNGIQRIAQGPGAEHEGGEAQPSA